jgi:triacylglycerol lipase
MAAGPRRDGTGPGERLHVLAPGYLGFERLGIGPLGVDYFRGLSAYLARAGLAALVVPPAAPGGGVETRARGLAAALDRAAQPRVTLIGHSMGGLDVRMVAHALDPARRIDRIVTLGTPHRGTPVAERMLTGRCPLAHLVRAIGREGLRELTPEACERRNRTLTDRDDVSYASLGGWRPAAELPLPLRLAVGTALDGAGRHDGLVPLDSTRWGTVAPDARADHFELVGWSLPLHGRRERFDHLAALADLLAPAA